MTSDAISAALNTPMKLGESPVWSPEENALYWIDIPGHALHRLAVSNHEHRSWPLPSEPGCITLCDDGSVLIAMRSGLAFFDVKTGELQPMGDPPYDPSVMRFNDGRCDAAGRLWVGALYDPRDKVAAPLYCVERGNVRDTGKRATVSNGVAFSLDNRTMFHADTTSHRIFTYEFDLATGELGEGKLFKQFSMDKANNYGGRPDGAAVDSEGAYWCAMMEGGRLLRFSPDGDLLREIALPARCPTMMAFGGEDLKTLYITTGRNNRSTDELTQYPLSGCVLSMRVDVAGRIEPRYRR